MSAAKRETTVIQPRGVKMVTLDVESTSLSERPVTTTKPHIIVIPRKANDTCSST